MSPRDLLARLRRLATKKGWSFRREEGGAHTLVWVNGRRTAVPRHAKDLGTGLLKKIVEKDLGLSMDDVKDA